MTTDAIVAWLTAQLDEDERIATEATAKGVRTLVTANMDKFRVVRHVANWEPDRAFRQLAAARLRLVEIKRQLADDPIGETAMHLLRVEAMPFADRPGFDPRWALADDQPVDRTF